MKFGLLMPHFGEHANRRALLDGAVLSESFGFDSLWVRDHLVFEPHAEMEAANNTFFEALTTLTAIGAVTEKISLGTGSLVPFRHPVHLAISIATITRLVGDRMILGFGAGTFDHEFELVGMGDLDRVELVRSNAEILQRLFTEDGVTYSDDVYSFENISIDPKPPGPIPFWYCGATPRSARLAAEYADGWMPGRTTLLTIEKRVETMLGLTAENGRAMPTVAVIPPTSIAASHEMAFDGLNIDGLLAWANKRGKWWVKPPSGEFATVEDIEGSLIAGDPDEVIEQVKRFQDVGVEHLVFDLRLTYERWFSSIELLGRHVLPAFR
ncbi:MAG: LLM class flavin-dependent oxidoreductase [Gemmatimonadales bacterium]|jgi:alkanesulfonate monooxygenase SsuD/methylene tetrahydromethanopterin reductase-like flavin-dependent oxidoreductase (luciferase family)|nr:LLM class flavin-dependent oxidoreductase [Gemmatimonadales bacterium]MBT4185743.1 LLM class flavin-dependent oxidoreductase [Gemmatimonadales bacterium]MBT6373513.1 LLM class flavin-dependent oxidoreductase [Gemmatimonadales bacterium]MBT7693691.1 LLM class flavin-dependent oxidoreductase [Gemmatimonadales bacterium]